MELKGTKTEQNLMTAFAGESQARNKYTYFASVAKKEGYEQIAAIFQQTADNEKEHAKLWFKALAFQFRAVAAIEKSHEERYRKLLSNVEMQKVFEKSEMTMWECRNCGHLVMGLKAPAVCPVCAHPQSYFEIRKENY